MKKILILSLFFLSLSCSQTEETIEPVKLKTATQPPPGCGTDPNGVKYCCNQFGNCWRENW